MKVENIAMAVGFVASVATFELANVPALIEVIGTGIGTFVGWQAGCLIDIIWANRHVTDPDPELTDAEIASFRKYADLTADERAFIAEHEAKQNRRRKPYIEDDYMDDDIKNV